MVKGSPAQRIPARRPAIAPCAGSVAAAPPPTVNLLAEPATPVTAPTSSSARELDSSAAVAEGESGPEDAGGEGGRKVWRGNLGR